ncbi:MAG: phosphoglycerate dehydrogenase [Alphaproteobacteria bacterium]|nr:phosphoglycerate dehydrogenase [Alphaproteobacteria bacterium]MBU0798255.1 phosphoglycerate dehydrogenase [Alphaproteobacteria bacterium]MBU0889017.1 phosphoglycerate dehydrogenase [Alphaproteobacteria bacterium]MBU1814037.1 phosphoglycerate dehydrogenase [Alphaproteobacteria bacterium]MBU2089085.1 phosphoglycerate dehydrogenase [Alphaproteobacteria bacterium]
MPKVLISDALSERAVDIFRERGIEVDYKPGMKADELIAVIANYDGLAIRSATKVTEAVLEQAGGLKVIGRAGIGVDNVDVPAATKKGVVVMNTPFGNSITTAEHAISLMMALARQIPMANASTHAGKWEKNRFMGVELFGKVLGVIGCGNIGAIVADRALGLKMKVVAFDPFLTEDRAQDLGVEKVELDELLARADFITLHTPLVDSTRNILNADTLAKTKPGVRIVNCARGGLVDEAALKAALESGHVAGAALDVFEAEPAKENALFGMDNVVVTPHLGASTSEAQENVALQVAEQMADYLLTGAISNAVNVPSVSAEEAPRLKPYMLLAEQLGSMLGQLTVEGIGSVTVELEGLAAQLNSKPILAAALAGLMKPISDSVNMVNAPTFARQRDIAVSLTAHDRDCDYQTLIRVTTTDGSQTRTVAGTLFGGRQPRLVEVRGIKMEADFGTHMLYVRNRDEPGFIGKLGGALGEAGINIASFYLGRTEKGGVALSLVDIDAKIDDAILQRIRGLPGVIRVELLSF